MRRPRKDTAKVLRKLCEATLAALAHHRGQALDYAATLLAREPGAELRQPDL